MAKRIRGVRLMRDPIVARIDVRLLVLDGLILRKILRDVPQLAIDMLRALSTRVCTADDRSKELQRKLSRA